MTCPICGAPTDTGALRCPQCGAVQPGVDPSAERDALPVYGADPAEVVELAPGTEPEEPRRSGRAVVLVLVVAMALFAVIAGVRSVAGGEDARAEALDTRTVIRLPDGVRDEPEEEWQVDLEASRMLGVDDVVVVAGEDSGAVIGFRTRDGDERWRVESSEPDLRVGWLSRLGSDGLLVAYLDDRDFGVAEVAALDADDGDVRWRHAPDGAALEMPVSDDVIEHSLGAGGAELSLISGDDGRRRWSVDGDLVGFGDDSLMVLRERELVAVDLETGDERWSRNLAGDQVQGGGSIQIGDTVVVLRSEHTVVGLSAEDGSFRWSRSTEDPVWSLSATGDLAIALGEGSATGIDVEDGDVRWTSAADDWQGTQLMRFGGRDELHAFGDRVTLLDAATGTRVARSVRVPYGGGPAVFFDLPAVSDSVIYVPGPQGRVLALDVGSLEQLWSLDVGTGSYQVAAVDRALVVATNDALIAYR